MCNFIKFEEISSTNKYSMENIAELPDKTVVAAQTQHSGRGRFARKWISDKKDNCYISFILKPDIKYRKNFPNLTQYLSVVLCQEIQKYNISPNIKWPNDVQINGKKIAGILSEAAFSDNTFKGIVLGLGVNLNLSEADLNLIDIPATSLNLETKTKIDCDGFIKNLVEHFFKGYENFLKSGFSAIKPEYLSFCNFLGKDITIKNPEPTMLGIAIGIDDDGSLEVLKPSGEKEKVISGDVILN